MHRLATSPLLIAKAPNNCCKTQDIKPNGKTQEFNVLACIHGTVAVGNLLSTESSTLDRSSVMSVYMKYNVHHILLLLLLLLLQHTNTDAGVDID